MSVAAHRTHPQTSQPWSSVRAFETRRPRDGVHRTTRDGAWLPARYEPARACPQRLAHAPSSPPTAWAGSSMAREGSSPKAVTAGLTGTATTNYGRGCESQCAALQPQVPLRPRHRGRSRPLRLPQQPGPPLRPARPPPTPRGRGATRAEGKRKLAASSDPPMCAASGSCPYSLSPSLFFSPRTL
jgi:hypothetical protein